jgi:hypothetical protein
MEEAPIRSGVVASWCPAAHPKPTKWCLSMHHRHQYQLTWACIHSSTHPRCKQLIILNSTLTLAHNLHHIFRSPLTLKWLIIREHPVNTQVVIISSTTIFNRLAARDTQSGRIKAILNLFHHNTNRKECICKTVGLNPMSNKFNMALIHLQALCLRHSLHRLTKDLITAWIRFISPLSTINSSTPLI